MSLVVDGTTASRWRRRLPRLLSRVSFGIGILAGGVAPALALLVDALFGSRVIHADVLPGAFGVAAFTAAAIMAVSYVLWFVRSLTPARVEVDAGRLRLVGAGVDVALTDVTSAYAVQRGRPEVEIVLRGGDLYAVPVASDVEARALVDELGFGPEGRRVHVELGTPRARLGHLGFGFAAYMISTFVTIPFNVMMAILELPAALSALVTALSLALTLALYRLFTRTTRPPEVTVGEDGFEVTMGRTTTFIRREDVLKIEWPVVFHRNGSLVLANPKLDAPRREAFFRALEDRMASGRHAGVSASSFERGGRSIAEWREHVRRAITDGSYRAAGISADDALAVLGSSNATPEQRVGAAFALGPTDRVRVAAGAIANPKVRVALEAAIEAEGDDAVDKALARAR